LTKVQIEYSDWINTGGVIDCATTSTCQTMSANLNQSCVANEASTDGSFQVALEKKLDETWWLKWAGLSSGTATGMIHRQTGNTWTTCNSNTDTGSCTWDDKACHAIWKGKRNRRVFGYTRRRCDKGRDGTNMSVKNGDYYTVGMLDFEIVMPDNQIIGCGAKCSDLNYPDPRAGHDYPLQDWPGTESGN
jgi:hypothetical protein